MSLARLAPGKQFVLEAGEQTATVTEVGAVLRSYTVAGRELLDGSGPDETSWDARGSTVIPWTGTLPDGRYSFGGAAFRLPVTEPGREATVHGLTRWGPWRLVDATPQRMVLRETVSPQPGYPFHLRCEIGYALGDAGLRVETTATNVGPVECPVTTGARPYLTLGTPLVDDLVVQVAGTPADLRQPAPLGRRVLETTYSGLARGDDGVASVLLRAPTGEAVEVWMDAAYTHVHLSTGDALPDPVRRRRGLGVAPSTAPPDAFGSGEGLAVLQPMESFSAAWGLRLLDR